MEKIKKWYTKVEYVDLETGELISKSLKIREYIELRKKRTIEIIKNEKNEKYGTIKYTVECEKDKQLRLL